MATLQLAPKTVRWARVYRGVSPEEAAKVLGGSLARLERLESQGEVITTGELRKLAKKYRLPMATLAMPEPPPVPEGPKDFRTLDGRDPSLSKATREAISTAQERQIALKALRDEEGRPIKPELPTATLAKNPEQLAETVRQQLEHLGVRDGSAVNPHTRFTQLRMAIEAQDVAVYALSFSTNECRGFSLFSREVPPAIVITTKEEQWEARSFTLMHEYGHLILRTPGISDLKQGNVTERWCNQFAAAFLMPRQSVVTLAGAPRRDIPFAELKRYASQFGVSQQAMALRLQELKLVAGDYFEKLLRHQDEAPKHGRTRKGGSYINTQLFSLGPGYVSAVKTAVQSGSINEVQAARLTQLAPRHFLGPRSPKRRARS